MSGAAGQPLEIVLHIPKCAGSTIEVHLLKHLGPEAFWSPRRRGRAVPIELFGRKYNGRMPAPPEAIRAISGHYIGRSVEARFAGRAIRRSVLMREPQALVLSWYNYRMARYRSLGQAGYPFGLHLACMPPDPLAHFLLANWLELPWARLARMDAGEKLARLEAAFAAFDFIGDVSDCDRLVAELSRRLGIPEAAEAANTAHGWRAETGIEPLRREMLAPEDAAELDRRTRLDTAFWRRVARREQAAFAAADAMPFLRSELRRPLAELARKRLRGRRMVDTAPQP
ncbi:hypothetical protein LNKW23_22310 [Paralimibaculum aggregatum]|uniref:Sulfotransferase family protein n=1 Tax=Paralimibaculum aggregatum TaxID=3036245 RepID=A0ABQ6LPX9_9RHOB|nr:hypothetical protein [Limibaculum sp. NKW23]GMG83018.1 hypothetical protein LNKW23_22310 [Limibaculum sp. NKW23]